jgi:hypothetical protein
MGKKLVELFANRVVERRNMINDYLRGRACIEGVRGGVDFRGSVNFELLPWLELFLLFYAFLSSSLSFCLALPLFVPFVDFCGFPSSR